MACKACEEKRKQEQKQEQKNLVYTPRSNFNQNKADNNKPASPKFQSPTVLPNPK